MKRECSNDIGTKGSLMMNYICAVFKATEGKRVAPLKKVRQALKLGNFK